MEGKKILCHTCGKRFISLKFGVHVCLFWNHYLGLLASICPRKHEVPNDAVVVGTHPSSENHSVLVCYLREPMHYLPKPQPDGGCAHKEKPNRMLIKNLAKLTWK